MDVRLLKDIKETEQKARVIIESAEKKRHEMVEQAKLDIVAEYQRFLQDLEAQKEKKLSEQAAEIRKQKKKMQAASEIDVEKIQQTASMNMDKAASFIIDSFKKSA